MFEETLTLSLEPLEGFCPVALGLDRGCSLTKVVALKRVDDRRGQLECTTFRNEDFREAIAWLKQRAPHDQPVVRVTGTGGDAFRREIANALGAKVEVIEEYPAHGRGLFFLLKRGEEAEFLHDLPPDVKNPARAPFPFLFFFVGSGTGGVFILEDGNGQMATGSLFGGKILLGMCKAILGTSDYDEVMALVAKGDANAVSLKAKDYVGDNPDSPYRAIPSELVLFPFGKMVDNNLKPEEVEKADLALAAADVVATAIGDAFGVAYRRFGQPRVLIGGNCTRNSAFRSLLFGRCVTSISYPGSLCPQFVRCSYTGAIGAMLTSPDVHWIPRTPPK